MNRIDRLTAILIQLQSKRIVRAREIAERFSISLRTVYRDIRALEDAGVPIGAQAGEGYYITDGYHLPPVMFTSGEAGALMLAGKLIDRFSDPSIRKQFDSALFKIKSVLEDRDKDYIDNLSRSIEVVSHGRPEYSESSTILSDLQLLVGRKKMVEITYRSGYRDEVTTRLIEPLGLCYWGGNWHLIAYCTLRKDYRDFRIDRIQGVTPTGIYFDAGRHDSLRNLMQRMNTPKELKPAVIRFHEAAAMLIREQKYYYGLVEEATFNDRVEMTFMTPSYRNFARWLITFLDQVDIVSPNELVELVRQSAEKLYYHHHC